MLAHEARVDLDRQQQHERDQHPEQRVDQRLQPWPPRDAPADVAHAPRKAGAEQDRGDADAVEEAPELQPVAAFEVRVRQLALLGRQQIRDRPRSRDRRRTSGLAAPRRASAAPAAARARSSKPRRRPAGREQQHDEDSNPRTIARMRPLLGGCPGASRELRRSGARVNRDAPRNLTCADDSRQRGCGFGRSAKMMPHSESGGIRTMWLLTVALLILLGLLGIAGWLKARRPDAAQAPSADRAVRRLDRRRGPGLGHPDPAALAVVARRDVLRGRARCS